MHINSLISAAAGQGYVAFTTQLLKKTQEIAATQAAQIVASLPPPPSPSGVGEHIDLVA